MRSPFKSSHDVVYNYASLIEVLDGLPVIMYFRDNETGNIIKCNSEFEKLRFSEHLDERKIVNLKEDDNHVISLPDPDNAGYLRFYRINTRQLGQPDRSLTLVTGWDITDEYINQQRADETDVLKSVFDRCNNMVFMTDNHGNIIFQNKALQDFTGKQHSVYHKNILNSLHPEDARKLRSAIDRTLKNEDGCCYEFRMMHSDGGFRWINIQLSSRRNENNENAGLICFLTDVNSERNQREEASASMVNESNRLEEINRNLQRSNDDLEQFAYVASHDLQEPVRKISIYSGKLQQSREPLNSPQNSFYLNKIIEATGRMSGMINDLLNYSILSRQKEDFRKTDLTALVKTVLEDYDLLIAQKNAQVELHPLPVIDANALLINQLFYNLIGNSLKFTSDARTPLIKISGRTIEVMTKNGYPQLMVEITVSDNGIGFNPAYSRKIFELFTRLNNKSQFKGSGIGLALCRKVVDGHNGTIQAESSGEGSVFRITLPLQQPSVPA